MRLLGYIINLGNSEVAKLWVFGDGRWVVILGEEQVNVSPSACSNGRFRSGRSLGRQKSDSEA